ncbi:MAG: hypothetical protein KG012_19615 [Deltaproteobacteria bacterium]|nr:hypothetical protein [Deltaproteobacteria bacterium]
MRDEKTAASAASRIHKWMVRILLVIMAIEWVLLIVEEQWLSAFMVFLTIAIVISPEILRKRFDVTIPTEFQILTIIFVFAALFLGEVRGFYARFWWWDIVLHISSGLLLGIVGFLLVFVLNEHQRIDFHMHPRFVALFAFVFAVAVGALWEIFEFGMDQIFGTNMQKPMLGDPSGLTDTMWDLIVDTLGAFAISTFGWWYMKKGQRSFVENWIHKFIDKNRRLFSPKKLFRR